MQTKPIANGMSLTPGKYNSQSVGYVSCSLKGALCTQKNPQGIFSVTTHFVMSASPLEHEKQADKIHSK